MKKLGDLAEFAGARLIGNPDLQITGASTTQRATAGEITFALSPKHLEQFLASECLASFVSAELDLPETGETEKSFLIVEDPESAFAELVKFFRPVVRRHRIGISEQALVCDSAEIAEDVDIFPGAYIGERVRIGCGSIIHPNVSILEGSCIGANTVVFPNAVIYENCTIGDRCIVHAGVAIGAYGFGYRSGEAHELVPQLGNVVIGNDVEIGSNSTIDRGTYDSTTIGEGSKLDDQVMIGHNCQIGRHNLLCSQVGIAGSCTTGDYVVMAGQVGIGDHLTIGAKTTLAAQSGVMHDLKGGQIYLGAPAIPVREQMQIHAVIAKLPEMRKQLRRLERDLENRKLATAADNEAA